MLLPDGPTSLSSTSSPPPPADRPVRADMQFYYVVGNTCVCVCVFTSSHMHMCVFVYCFLLPCNPWLLISRFLCGICWQAVKNCCEMKNSNSRKSDVFCWRWLDVMKTKWILWQFLGAWSQNCSFHLFRTNFSDEKMLWNGKSTREYHLFLLTLVGFSRDKWGFWWKFLKMVDSTFLKPTLWWKDALKWRNCEIISAVFAKIGRLFKRNWAFSQSCWVKNCWFYLNLQLQWWKPAAKLKNIAEHFLL